MDFELRHLRHVQALAEHRSFARAASALSISQPALSRSILELERRVGVPLFTRGREGVETTDAGRVLLQRAQSLLADAAELHRHLRLLRGLDAGTLRIGAGTYPSEMFVGAAVARMVREHPGVGIEVRTRCVDEQFAALRRREIDIAITEAPWAQQQPDMHVAPLTWHQAYLVARPGHPLLARARVDWPEALKYPVLISPRVPPEILSELRRAAGRTGTPTLVGCDTPTMMKQVARQSDALAILPTCLFACTDASPSLVPLDLTAPWLGRAFGIVRLATRRPSTTEEAFERFLVDADREASVLRFSPEPPARPARRRGAAARR